jgi:hypothetical protein
VTARWLAPLTVVTVLLAGCGAAPPSGGPAGRTPGSVVPFGTFLAGVRTARWRDYARRAGTRARGPEEFGRMRRYLLDQYAGAQVAHSYAESGAVFDCVGQPGAAGGGPCPAGSVPVRRITLAQLTRFPTLAAFLAKSPGGHDQLPPAGPGPG